MNFLGNNPRNTSESGKCIFRHMTRVKSRDMLQCKEKNQLTTNQLRPAAENYVQKPNKERDSTKTKKVRIRLKNSITVMLYLDNLGTL